MKNAIKTKMRLAVAAPALAVALILLVGIFGFMFGFGCTGVPPNTQNATNKTNGTAIGNNATTEGGDEGNGTGTGNQATPACEDSDGGNDITVVGAVTVNGIPTPYRDSCKSIRQVKEYFCTGTAADVDIVDCPQGTECHEGACIVPGSSFEQSCVDSDGTNIYGKGEVNQSGSIFEDKCLDDRTIKEYYCQGGLAKSENSQCPEGYKCQNGACVDRERTCTDSDGGNDIYSYGAVNAKIDLIESQYMDKCLDDKRLRENYCTNNVRAFSDVYCPGDYKCMNGACRLEACVDSDGGVSPYQQGAVTKGDNFYRDFCTDYINGVEYYCEDNQVKEEPFRCLHGYKCVDGYCKAG